VTVFDNPVIYAFHVKRFAFLSWVMLESLYWDSADGGGSKRLQNVNDIPIDAV
jgi:hypothetical protein